MPRQRLSLFLGAALGAAAVAALPASPADAQSRSERGKINDFLDEYRFTGPRFVRPDTPRFFVEACRKDRKFLLMFADDGSYFGRRRMGACETRAREPEREPEPRAVSVRELRYWLEDRNYSRIEFTDETPPDRVAEACLNGQHYTVRFDARGNATPSSKWFSNKCSGTRDRDEADNRDRDRDRGRDVVDNRDRDRVDNRDRDRDRDRARNRDDLDDRDRDVAGAMPTRRAASRSLRRGGYDTVRFDRNFARSGLVQACQGVRRFRLRLSGTGSIRARRVDGFCADNIGKAQFVPPRPSERELDPRGRGALDPERCQLVLQWLEYRNPITFDSAEDRISRDSEPLLRTIADSLERCRDTKLRLTGHTDSIGPRRFNLRLSRDRAIAVKDYLERRGVPTRRMVTEGFGEQYPVAGNLEERDRARNRRINLILEWGTDRELGFASRRDERDDG